MLMRKYKLNDIGPAAELRRYNPPWWLHALLFALILFLFGAVATLQPYFRAFSGGR